MNAFDYILYFIWACFPLFFLLVSLYSKLEHMSGEAQRNDSSEHFKQSIFLAICAGLAFLIDTYGITFIKEKYQLGNITTYFRIVLYPLLLFILGSLLGGSKKIEIEENPLLRYNVEKNKDKK